LSLAPVERVDADIAIVGSGFAGSLLSLALARRGRRVVMVERGRHPRFAIGESSTPLANLLLEELADQHGLPRLRAFSKWGTWQRERPEVAGGLKRGFTFFFHRPGEPFADDREHQRQLLVAASPHDEVADTHWYRPDFDLALVQDAQSEGVIYLDNTRLDRIADEGGRAVLEGSRGGRTIRIAAPFVVDASGARGFLHRALGVADAPLRWLPPTQALFSHFADVDRWDGLMPPDETPPYPRDDAALHHVFPGGWIWMLRFNNGITSAGAALTDSVAANIGAADGAPAWDRLLDTLPSVRDQFRRARATLPFVHSPRLAFRGGTVTASRWTCLPSAAGVIDPLLSTGFPLTLLGITRLAGILDETKQGSERDRALQGYAQITERELDATEQLVGALYANMSDTPLFKKLSLLYFAVASYSEAARRLGRPELAPGFLLHAHPAFGPELQACTSLALTHAEGETRRALLDRIDRAIEPFDTAGLLDRARRDWYPVLPDDLLGSASKLGATVDDVQRLLERCGFVAARESSQVSARRAAGPTSASA